MVSSPKSLYDWKNKEKKIEINTFFQRVSQVQKLQKVTPTNLLTWWIKKAAFLLC